MKILFLSEHYYPKLSGIPVVVKYLAEGLVKIGHEVSVATCLVEGTCPQENINGVDVYRFDIYENIAKLPSGEKDKYSSFVRDFEKDVMIVEYTQCVTTDLILPYLKDLQCKKIFHSHGFAGMEIKKPFAICDGFLHTIGHTYNWFRSQVYFKWWFKKYFKYFDAGLVLSEVESGKAYMTQFLGEKCFILGNAADAIFFSDDKSSKNPLDSLVRLNSKRYCFSCANYTSVKNQKGMIKEFYKTSDKDLALVCIGSIDTKYYYECKKLVEDLDKRYGKREVVLLYKVKREFLPAIMRHATIYLTSSTYEQYSISLIETMSQGVPFVSTNTGNARLLPGGITVKNITEMSKAIDGLISNESMYRNLSLAGKKFSYDNCQVNVAVNKLDTIIRGLV